MNAPLNFIYWERTEMRKNHLGLTKTIAQFVTKTNNSDIPPIVYEHAKIAFLDWFAVTLAGKDEPLVLKLIHFAGLLGGHKQASILGHGLRTNVSMAALINGSASHALDYDDTMKAFMGHPSVTLFPSLLALSEWKEKSGMPFLTAYIIGLQVGAFIGICLGLKHFSAGWHATSTVGRLASAAGCAKLLGLDEQQTLYTLGIAGTQASGLQRVFGTMCKPFHAGRASQIGLEAALLGAESFTCAEDILEGAGGFFQIFKGRENNEAIGSLGKTWDIEGLVQKYHASCHFTHSPTEALLDIVNTHGIRAKDIRFIKAYVSQMALNTLRKGVPRTGLEGKFSLQYCMANAILRARTGMEAFTDEKVRDPEVQDLMEKITLERAQNMNWTESRVEVKLNSGEVYSKFFDALKEIPKLDQRKTRTRNKFIDLCCPIMGHGRSEELMKFIFSIEKLDNVKTFLERLHTDPGS